MCERNEREYIGIGLIETKAASVSAQQQYKAPLSNWNLRALHTALKSIIYYCLFRWESDSMKNWQ